MMFFLDELDEVVHDPVVKVLTTQVSVTSCGHHLKHAIVDGQDGHIKGSTTQVKDQDVVFTTLLVKAIGNGCCCWLIDDTLNSQTGNDTSVLCGLPLGVIEVCWDCHHSMLDRLAKIGLCTENVKS